MSGATPTRTLTILDVGHGNSAILTDSNGVIVIDAGRKSSLLEYLTKQDIKKIDVVLISHADEDHIGGLVALLASDMFQIDRIRLNSDALQDSVVWEGLLHELDRQNNTGEIDFKPSLTTGDTGDFDQGAVRIEILGPSGYLAAKGPGSKDKQGRKIRSNSISAVVRLSEDGVPIALLPGDLDNIGLDDLIDHHVDVTAPILVFPHHGGKAGSTDMVEFSRRLCEIVAPKTVVFSIGRGSTLREEVVATVRQQVTNVRIACTQLSEHCASSLPEVSPTHLNEVFSKGHEYNKCCAGTMIVDLENSDAILPLQRDHQSFILAAAPTALCQRDMDSFDLE